MSHYFPLCFLVFFPGNKFSSSFASCQENANDRNNRVCGVKGALLLDVEWLYEKRSNVEENWRLNGCDNCRSCNCSRHNNVNRAKNNHADPRLRQKGKKTFNSTQSVCMRRLRNGFLKYAKGDQGKQDRDEMDTS